MAISSGPGMAAAVQALLEQANQSVAQLQAKDAELQAKNAEIEQKDFKIQALTLELAHLPRIEHRHEPDSCACGQCGKARVKICEGVNEQLDVEPAKFFVHRTSVPMPCLRDRDGGANPAGCDRRLPGGRGPDRQIRRPPAAVSAGADRGP
jgi:hypothetical protein